MNFVLSASEKLCLLPSPVSPGTSMGSNFCCSLPSLCTYFRHDVPLLHSLAAVNLPTAEPRRPQDAGEEEPTPLTEASYHPAVSTYPALPCAAPALMGGRVRRDNV